MWKSRLVNEFKLPKDLMEFYLLIFKRNQYTFKKYCSDFSKVVQKLWKSPILGGTLKMLYTPLMKELKYLSNVFINKSGKNIYDFSNDWTSVFSHQMLCNQAGNLHVQC